MDFELISRYISHQRLNNYLVVCNGNKQKALKLYQTNLRVSQSFYALLSLLEVILRNAINENLQKHFSDKDWILNQTSKFMSDSSLVYKKKKVKMQFTNTYLKDCVNSSKNEIIKNHKDLTADQIVANISFGFWVALFDKHHAPLIEYTNMQIFKSLPTEYDHNKIHKTLSDIRDFRNRIYHNEPVIFKFQNKVPIFSIEYCFKAYSDLKQIFYFLNIDFPIWTRRIDNVALELKRAEIMYKYYPQKKYIIHRLAIGISHLKSKYKDNLLSS